MESIEIKGTLRKDLGKKSTKKLRNEGYVPSVIYGGKENIHFYGEEKTFHKIIYTPNVYLINLNIEGETHKTVIQDIQFHPVTDIILHVDFVKCFEDKEIIVKIPVKLTGSSIGLKNGGKLRSRRRILKIKGLPKDLPDFLEIDISDIDIGDSVKVQELSYDNISLIDPPRAMVVGVVSSRLAQLEETIAETEEGEEGEEATEKVPVKGEEAPNEKSSEKK